MRAVGAIAEVRAAVGEARRAGRGIAYVPEGGASRARHLPLVGRAREEADAIVGAFRLGRPDAPARSPRRAVVVRGVDVVALAAGEGAARPPGNVGAGAP